MPKVVHMIESCTVRQTMIAIHEVYADVMPTDVLTN